MTLVMLYASTSEVGLEKIQMQLLVALMNNSDKTLLQVMLKARSTEIASDVRALTYFMEWAMILEKPSRRTLW